MCKTVSRIASQSHSHADSMWWQWKCHSMYQLSPRRAQSASPEGGTLYSNQKLETESQNISASLASVLSTLIQISETPNFLEQNSLETMFTSLVYFHSFFLHLTDS